MRMKSAQYVGRFAPSPTGPLHFGSLLAAMASYCDARNHNGSWHLRIDDIDPPRAMPGAIEQIQQTLKAYGFSWDGEVLLQSLRTQHYLRKLQRLNELHLLFPCDCTRRRLRDQPVYPGYCNPISAAPIRTTIDAANIVKTTLRHGNQEHAIRVIVDTSIWFNDRIQGEQTFDDGEPGDTIVVRRDDLFSYALACAVDDADGITHVVRGYDLLSTTASQLAIIKRLDLPTPSYAHIPVVVNKEQQKLSKQTHAPSLDAMPVLITLLNAWKALGQCELQATTVDAFWLMAIPAWKLASVPMQSQLDMPV